MKQSKILLIFLIFFFYSTGIKANTAFINLEFLINTSKVGIYINDEINKIIKVQSVDFEKKEKDLKKNESELLSKKNITEKDQYEKELIKFKNNIFNYNNYKKKLIRSTQEKKINSINKLMKIIQPLLTKYIDKNNITVLLDKKNILIGNNELDITPDIIILLNEKVKKMELE